MKKLVVKASLLLAGLIPATAFAQFDPAAGDTDLPELPGNAPTDFGTLITVIVTIARWMFGILMALAIVFILYAAFLYIIAQGNEDRIKTAKTILIYAVVGLVVAVLAGGISVIVQDFITDI